MIRGVCVEMHRGSLPGHRHHSPRKCSGQILLLFEDSCPECELSAAAGVHGGAERLGPFKPLRSKPLEELSKRFVGIAPWGLHVF